MQPLTGPYVYGVNRRSEIFSFCQIYLLCEEGVPEADINVLKIMLFWAVYSILWCARR